MLLQLELFQSEQLARPVKPAGPCEHKSGFTSYAFVPVGHVTFEARRMGLERIKSIQARAGVDLINAAEEARILELIEAETWPRGWDGTEPIASAPFENVNPDETIQRELEVAL